MNGNVWKLMFRVWSPGEFMILCILRFCCDVCGMKFIDKSYFEVHSETHNPHRKCEKCGQLCKSKLELKLHTKSHLGEFRNANCVVWNNKFLRVFKNILIKESWHIAHENISIKSRSLVSETFTLILPFLLFEICIFC